MRKLQYATQINPEIVESYNDQEMMVLVGGKSAGEVILAILSILGGGNNCPNNDNCKCKTKNSCTNSC